MKHKGVPGLLWLKSENKPTYAVAVVVIGFVAVVAAVDVIHASCCRCNSRYDSCCRGFDFIDVVVLL